MSRFYYWFLELFLGILLASFFVFLLLLWTKHLALNLGFSYQDCFLPASHGFMFGMLYISIPSVNACSHVAFRTILKKRTTAIYPIAIPLNQFSIFLFIVFLLPYPP